MEQAGALLLANLRAKGRKRSTLEVYSSHLRVHLVPFFASRPLDRIGATSV